MRKIITCLLCFILILSDVNVFAKGSAFEEHWSYYHFKSYTNTVKNSEKYLKPIADRLSQPNASLNNPIKIEEWNDLILNTLYFEINDKIAREYTLGLSSKEYIRRGQAVAGIIKLLHIKGYVKARDATQEEYSRTSKAFKDYSTAFDASKLSIAYTEGLINGYEDGTFGSNRNLTYGEAFVLLNSVALKYLKPNNQKGGVEIYEHSNPH